MRAFFCVAVVAFVIEVVRELDVEFVHVTTIVELELLWVELAAKHLVEFLLVYDLDLFFVGLGSLVGRNVCGAGHDPEAADVAAGDLAAVVRLGKTPLLIHAHRPVLDRQPPIKRRLPSIAEPVGVAAVVAQRSEVASTARPGIHVALGLTVWVPCRLCYAAGLAVGAVAVDGEAMP